MSAQETLTKDAPMILDATCSFKHEGRTPNWPAYATLRMDVRREVGPEIVADARFLPFRPHVFAKIYADFPHMIRKDPFIRPHDRILKRRFSGRLSPSSFERYGHFSSYEEAADVLTKSALEFERCLTEGGCVFYKWCYGSDRRLVRRKDLDLIKNLKVIDESVTPSRAANSKNMVSWLTMKPTTHSKAESATD